MGVWEALFVTVVGGLLLAAAVGGWKWLSSEENREMAKTTVREKLCQHEWEAPPDDFFSPHAEWCRKCNARR